MTQSYNPENLQAAVFALLRKNAADRQVKAEIARITKFKDTKTRELFHDLVDAFAHSGEKVEIAERVEEEALEQNDRYTYNKESDQYVVFLKSAGRNVVIPGQRHREMLEAYSNWNGSSLTINEICRSFSLPKSWFEEYRSIMGWTHDHEPVTKEELDERQPEDIVTDLLQRKRFALNQEFQKRDWKQTQEDATKWREYQAGYIDPFEAALANWKDKKPGELQPYHGDKPTGGSSLVVGCFDWHHGSLAEERSLFRQKSWNINLAKKAIEVFVDKLTAKVRAMGKPPSEIVVLFGGDLMHALRGSTVKGTKLICDRLKETQFDAIFESLILFVSAMGRLAPAVRIHAVQGNHEGFDMYPLLKGVEAYFRTDERLKFDVSSSHTVAIRIRSVLLLLNHGVSAEYKHKVPNKGKARESYVQSLLLGKPELLVGVKQKIFVQGDLHHYEDQHFETNDVEFFMFGALPFGDVYADSLNLHSRPRQNCMLIDDSGIAEVWHIYFD